MYTAEQLSQINPDFNVEIMSEVDRIINQFKGKPGNLIPVLEACQAVTGYLPVELQEYISEQLNIPSSTVYGVVTFYSFFTMVPKGRHTIRVCRGTACYVKGISAVLTRLRAAYNIGEGETTEDRRFSLDAVRCLGACGLAPVFVVDGDIYGGITPDRVVKILEQYE
jgi:NADH:ubiquinone oxidoreductase subunit E